MENIRLFLCYDLAFVLGCMQNELLTLSDFISCKDPGWLSLTSLKTIERWLTSYSWGLMYLTAPYCMTPNLSVLDLFYLSVSFVDSSCYISLYLLKPSPCRSEDFGMKGNISQGFRQEICLIWTHVFYISSYRSLTVAFPEKDAKLPHLNHWNPLQLKQMLPVLQILRENFPLIVFIMPKTSLENLYLD